MRNNLIARGILTVLMLLVVCCLPITRTAVALSPGPPPGQTFLDIKQSGAQVQWGSTRIIQALNVVTFRWKTSASNTAYGVWEIMDYEPDPNGLNEQPFAKGSVPLPQPGQFGHFTIDFAQLQQQHPDKIPASAPAPRKNYYVRLVPWTSGTMLAASISPAVRISYGSNSGFQAGGSTLTSDLGVTDVRITPNRIALFGQGILGVFVNTSKQSSMAIRVSQSAPVSDSNHNPTFASGMVENSVRVSSFHTQHYVGLFDLKGETHYYYIIEVTDKEGHKAYIQGDFEMGKLRTPLG